MAYQYNSPPPPCHYEQGCAPNYKPPGESASPPSPTTIPKAPSYPPKSTPAYPPKSTPAYPPGTPTTPATPIKPQTPAYPPHHNYYPYPPSTQPGTPGYSPFAPTSPYSPVTPGGLTPFSPPSDFIVPTPPGGGGGNNTTTIIAVCVSLGGVFFLAFLALGLFCLAKKKKKPVLIPAVPCEPEEAPTREHAHGGGEITGAGGPPSRGYQ